MGRGGRVQKEKEGNREPSKRAIGKWRSLRYTRETPPISIWHDFTYLPLKGFSLTFCRMGEYREGQEARGEVKGVYYIYLSHSLQLSFTPIIQPRSLVSRTQFLSSWGSLCPLSSSLSLYTRHSFVPWCSLFFTLLNQKHSLFNIQFNLTFTSTCAHLFLILPQRKVIKIGQ